MGLFDIFKKNKDASKEIEKNDICVNEEQDKKFLDFKEMIEKMSDADIVSFGKFGNWHSKAEIEEAENRLKTKFPESYKWWLNRYSGGEIYGNEIYSLYDNNYDDESYRGDIVYINERKRKNGNFDSKMLVFCDTDEETFAFDTSKKNENNEYPVYEIRSNKLYADNFISFFEKIF